MKATIRSSLALTAVAASIAGFAPKAIAADATKPTPHVVGEVIGEKVTVSATVEDVDVAKRMVTLKDENGKITDLKVGKEVRNLAQVKKGDVVTATYREAVAYEVYKPGQAQPGGAEAVVAGRAKLGEKPAGGVAEVSTVTATIEAIDKAASKVTLKGPEGHEVTVKVKDPTKLDGVKVGDEVQLTFTQALAISVHPAPKQ
jgi:Cu/Ag efflux protein CusF